MGEIIDIEPRLLQARLRHGMLSDQRTLELARAFVVHTELEVFQHRMTLQNPRASQREVSEALHDLPVLESLLRNRKHCLDLVEDEVNCNEQHM
jgi:hypothetical protein